MRVFLLLIALLIPACNVTQARIGLGVATAFDAITTRNAIKQQGFKEGNQILAKAPITIMVGLAALVAASAEYEIHNGNIRQGITLYNIATIVHTLAALWNCYIVSIKPLNSYHPRME